MQVEVIPMLINSDFMEVSLDVLMYLADYKMYGESSFVYQDKSKLYKVYEASNISMNDRKINGETLEYFAKNNKNVGKALSQVYGIEQKEQIETLSNITAIVNNSTALRSILNSETALNAIANSKTAMTTIGNSNTAMNTIINNSDVMNFILNSNVAMNFIAGNKTAMTTIANSNIAMNAILNNSTALDIVMNNSTAMNAVVGSNKAMEVIANSAEALKAIADNQVAMTALINSPLKRRLGKQQTLSGLLLVLNFDDLNFNTEEKAIYSRVRLINGAFNFLWGVGRTQYAAPGAAFKAYQTPANYVFVGTWYDNPVMDVIVIKTQ